MEAREPCLFLRNADTSVLLEITEEEQTFFFDNISEYPVPSLLQDFSAPVKLEYPYSLDDLAALMSRDEDGFNRWKRVSAAGHQPYEADALSISCREQTNTQPSLK